MPYRRPDSGVWWISYTRAEGGRVREPSGAKTQGEAKALEAKRRLEVHRVKRWGEAERRTFDELMSAYLTDTADKKSHDRDLFMAANLARYFSGLAMADLAGVDIGGYRKFRKREPLPGHKKKPLTDATIAKELMLLSAAIKYANKHWEWRLNNPVSGRVPRVKTKAPRWLNAEERPVFIAACSDRAKSPHLKDFAVLSMYSGLRKSEALDLEWQRVDFGARLIYFDTDDQKGARPGSVPMNDTVVEVLRRRLKLRNEQAPQNRYVFFSGETGHIQNVKKGVYAAARRAKLKGVSPHTLRHTFAAMLVQAGVPLRTVCELCRHKDIRTTMRYAHLAPENTRAGIAVLDRDQNVTEPGHLLATAGTSGHNPVTLAA